MCQTIDNYFQSKENITPKSLELRRYTDPVNTHHVTAEIESSIPSRETSPTVQQQPLITENGTTEKWEQLVHDMW